MEIQIPNAMTKFEGIYKIVKSNRLTDFWYSEHSSNILKMNMNFYGYHNIIKKLIFFFSIFLSMITID